MTTPSKTTPISIRLYPEEIAFARQIHNTLGHKSVAEGIREAFRFYAEQKHLDPATGLPLPETLAPAPASSRKTSAPPAYLVDGYPQRAGEHHTQYTSRVAAEIAAANQASPEYQRELMRKEMYLELVRAGSLDGDEWYSGTLEISHEWSAYLTQEETQEALDEFWAREDARVEYARQNQMQPQPQIPPASRPVDQGADDA